MTKNHYYKTTVNNIDNAYKITIERKGVIALTIKLETTINRNGFKHKGEIWINNNPKTYTDDGYRYGNAHGSIQYYNRTWERYRYQSLIRELIQKGAKSAGIDNKDNKIFKKLDKVFEEIIRY